MAQTLGVPVAAELDRRDPDAPLVWVLAFAVGVLIDAVHFAEPPISLYTVVTVAAVGVALNPASRRRLLALCASLATATLWYLPDIWNHWVLVGVLGATFTVWIGWRILRDRAEVPTNAELVEQAAPFLRVAFLLTFALAAFAKLNSGFLDAATSCALWIVERVPGVPVVPDGARPAFVATGLGVELLIPTLLVFRRTRLAGIAVAWVFHLATAVGGHASFAAFAWSFYLLFLPRPMLDRATVIMRDRWRRIVQRTDRRIGYSRTRQLFWPAVGVWLAIVALVQLVPLGPAGRVQRLVAAVFYLVWAVATGVMLVRAYLQVRAGGQAATSERGFWAVGVGPTVALSVILLSGASPYLGFKTQYSFTMYSDLRTEAGEWNHLVVPESVKVGTWQDDLVVITATDDSALAADLRLTRDGPGTVLPLLEARRLAYLFPDAQVEYRYDDVPATAERFADDPIVGEDLPWIMRKVARFRPALTPAGTACQH